MAYRATRSAERIDVVLDEIAPLPKLTEGVTTRTGIALVGEDAHLCRARLGVVSLDADKPGPLLTRDQRRLVGSLMDQAPLAIERVRLRGPRSGEVNG